MLTLLAVSGWAIVVYQNRASLPAYWEKVQAVWAWLKSWVVKTPAVPTPTVPPVEPPKV